MCFGRSIACFLSNEWLSRLFRCLEHVVQLFERVLSRAAVVAVSSCITSSKAIIVWCPFAVRSTLTDTLTTDKKAFAVSRMFVPSVNLAVLAYPGAEKSIDYVSIMYESCVSTMQTTPDDSDARRRASFVIENNEPPVGLRDPRAFCIFAYSFLLWWSYCCRAWHACLTWWHAARPFPFRPVWVIFNFIMQYVIIHNILCLLGRSSYFICISPFRRCGLLMLSLSPQVPMVCLRVCLCISTCMLWGSLSRQT